MPKREDLNKILIIGSGPIVIGQACEFDYSGTRACKALRSLGYEIVLANKGILEKYKVEVIGMNLKAIEKGEDRTEFDYCCVHASFAIRDAGYESIMVNCRPAGYYFRGWGCNEKY